MNILLGSAASQGGFDTNRVFLCVIRVMAEVKCLLKLLKSHSWMAIKGRTSDDYMDVSAAACFRRVWCPVFVGDVNSSSSLACGMVKLPMSYQVWVFSWASVRWWAEHVVLSVVSSLERNASRVDKWSLLLLLCAVVWGLSTSHSCLLHGMVRGTKALLKPFFCRFLSFSIGLHLPQLLYTSAVCA